MPEEKQQLIHPHGKRLPIIGKDKYEMLKAAILGVLKGRALTHAELFAALEKEMAGKFSGSVSWYAEGVKLDLEARHLIERTDTKPQTYRLHKKD